MAIVSARFIGQVFIPDQPVDLLEGEAVDLEIRRRERLSTVATGLLARLPLIHLAPEDAEAINRDPEFNVEEA